MSVVVAGVLLATNGSNRAGQAQETPSPVTPSAAIPAPAVVIVDAGESSVDALMAPRTATLLIETTPPGGYVWINGARQGTAPISVPVPVDSEVVVRADLAGHETTTQSVRITDGRDVVRLTLAPLDPDDPLATPADKPSERSSGGKRKRRRSEAKKPGTGTGSAAGSGSAESPRFNPNDVGGD